MSESLDVHRELFELTRAFRQHLAFQQRAGCFGVVDGPTRGPDDVVLGPVVDTPREPATGRGGRAHQRQPPTSEGRGRGRGDRPPPAEPDGPRYGDVTPQDALGMSMSEALAHALGDDEPRRHEPSRRTEPPRLATASTPSAEPMDLPSWRDPERGEPTAPRISLAQVRAELGNCTRCKLAPTRTNIVFGVGDPDAALMFIGEGPGAQEDRRGEPFVGPAGQLLDKMIAAMGWSRQTVYIANVVKCRPPRNRDPEPDEVAACEPFLVKQIASVRPRVIVTLGRPATHLVLRTGEPISRLRGQFRSYQGIPVMPTFHPAYLLRNEAEKRTSWQDLQAVMAELEQMGIRPPHRPRR